MKESMRERILKAERLCAEKMFDIAIYLYLKGDISKDELDEAVTDYVKVIDMGLTADETL